MSESQRGFRTLRRYFDHLAGDERMNGEHGSEAVRWIREHITDTLLRGMTWQQRDRLERAASAVLGALRTVSFIEQGWTLRSWRPGRGQPGVERFGGKFYDWSHDLGGWRDHTYRLTKTDEGGQKHAQFISEPYGLDERGLRSLVALIDAGWDVHVDADWALHYPGSTLRVVISKKHDDPAEPPPAPAAREPRGRGEGS